MAYTKIHAIKATVDKAIEYICNPDKTDEQIYVSSYACASETSAIDFKYTLDHCRENRRKNERGVGILPYGNSHAYTIGKCGGISPVS